MPKIPDCPLISDELLDYLKAMFPDKCPELTESERQIFYKSGQRSVVQHLINKKQEQEEK
jgi:hypothetical protein